MKYVIPALEGDGVRLSKTLIIGKALIVRAFYEKEDVNPLWNHLYARTQKDPSDAAAFMDLSIMLHCMGQTENAKLCQIAALESSRTFVIANGSGKGPRVLVFVTAGDFMTNTPIEFLLEPSDATIILHYVDDSTGHLEISETFDFAFIAISEYGNTAATLNNLERLIKDWRCPVMNRKVKNITRLSRDALHATFKNDKTVHSPLVMRVPRHVVEALAAGKLQLKNVLGDVNYPIIARPFGTHAGEGMEKINAASEFQEFLSRHQDQEFYLTQFVDYSGKDGKFRKQRLAFIDGKAYASHMAVSEHWMVHYLNADMEHRPERRLEEAAWMESFDDDFAKRHAASFDSLRRRIGLDYFVVDCAEMPDGRLLLFEADVAMIVHSMDSNELFPYKKKAMEKIFRGFNYAVERRFLMSRGETDIVCAHTGLPEISQRTESDCLVCCVAMLTGQSYEEVEQIAVRCDSTYLVGGPMSHSIMSGVAEKLGIAVFSSIYMYWQKPAIIGVISPTQMNTGHAVFWDGQKIIDPSNCQNVDRGYVDRNGIEFTQTAESVIAMLALPQMNKYVASLFVKEEPALLG